MTERSVKQNLSQDNLFEIIKKTMDRGSSDKKITVEKIINELIDELNVYYK